MFIEPGDYPHAFGGGPSAAEVDRLAEIARLESEIAKLQGEQMVHMAAHVGEVQAAWVAAGDPYANTNLPAQSAFAEINLVLRESGRYADNRIGEACALAANYPATLAQVRAGRLSRYRATIIAEHLANLEPADRVTAEAEVLEVAPGLTPAKLRDKCQRVVARIDATAVIKRRQGALKTRRVTITPDHDGMAWFSAHVSAERAIEMFGVVDAAAHAAKTPGDERTLDERRADALYDLICHPTGGAKRIRYQIQLLVPVGTVLGLGDEPGHLPGYGPIPADICRELAADATWRRILTDPVTNTTLDVHPNRYRPGALLSRFIHLRDKTCRWPGCNRTRVETDHTIRREHGGPTIRRNLGDFCKHHHDMKDAPGWKVVQDDNGVFTFTTPSGRVYRTRPPSADGEVKPVEEIPIPEPEGRRKSPPPPEDEPPPF